EPPGREGVSRSDRPGVRSEILARDEPARIAPRRYGRRGVVASSAGAAQHLGDRRARGLLEVRRMATADGSEARIVSARGLELLRAAAAEDRRGVARGSEPA